MGPLGKALSRIDVRDFVPEAYKPKLAWFTDTEVSLGGPPHFVKVGFSFNRE